MACVTPIHRASSVSCAISSFFFSTKQPCVILSKSSWLEFYDIDSSGLAKRFECNLYDRIVTIINYRPSLHKLERIIVVTNNLYYVCLYFDREKNKVCVAAEWKALFDFGLQKMDCDPISKFDAKHQLLYLYLYQGVITIIQMNQGRKRKQGVVQDEPSEPIHCRIEEFKVIDFELVENSNPPILAVLAQDYPNHFTVYFYQVEMKTSDMVKLDYKISSLSPTATKLISYPKGGLIVLEEQSLLFFEHAKSQPVKTSCSAVWKSACLVKLDEWILGDDRGNYYSLVYHPVHKLQLTKWEEKFSPPTCMVLLPENHLFIGSHFADSLLIKLKTKEVCQIFPNIAPILDFSSYYDASGRAQIITCSGAYHTGSLRILRYEFGTTDMQMISGTESYNFSNLFTGCLFPTNNMLEHDLVVLSSSSASLFLRYNASEESFEELSHPYNFLTKAPTIAFGDMFNYKWLVQVTPATICAFDFSMQTIQQLEIETELAVVSSDQIIVSHRNVLKVLHWSTETESLTISSSFECSAEICCIDKHAEHSYLIVGLWDKSVAVFNTEGGNLKMINHCKVASVPKSVVIAKLAIGSHEMSIFLMTSDGSIHCSPFHPTSKHKIKLTFSRTRTSPKPLKLYRYVDNSEEKVFVAAESPFLLFSRNDSVASYSLDLPNGHSIASFVCPKLNSRCVIGFDGGVYVGSIETNPQLQIRTITLEETPRRICFDVENNLFVVITLKLIQENLSMVERTECYFHVLSADTFEILASYAFDADEFALSLCHLKELDLFATGTGHTTGNKDESNEGQIVLKMYHPATQKLNVIVKLPTEGAVYCLASSGNLLAAGVSSEILIYSVSTDDLTACCRIDVPSIPITCKFINNEELLVGDLMYSYRVLKMRESHLEKGYVDENPLWTAAIEVWDEKNLLIADAEGRLQFVQLQTDDWKDKQKLTGSFHKIHELQQNEMINAIHNTDIFSKYESKYFKPKSLFATVDGSLILVSKINHVSDSLATLQSKLLHTLERRGEHYSSNSILTDTKKSIIDSDVLLRAKNLPEQEMKKIIVEEKDQLDAEVIQNCIYDLERVQIMP